MRARQESMRRLSTLATGQQRVVAINGASHNSSAAQAGLRHAVAPAAPATRLGRSRGAGRRCRRRCRHRLSRDGGLSRRSRHRGGAALDDHRDGRSGCGGGDGCCCARCAHCARSGRLGGQDGAGAGPAAAAHGSGVGWGRGGAGRGGGGWSSRLHGGGRQACGGVGGCIEQDSRADEVRQHVVSAIPHAARQAGQLLVHNFSGHRFAETTKQGQRAATHARCRTRATAGPCRASRPVTGGSKSAHPCRLRHQRSPGRARWRRRPRACLARRHRLQGIMPHR